MLRFLVISYLVGLIVALSAVQRVWRANAFDGVLTLLVPGYVFFAMAKYWNEPSSDIRYHTFLLVLCSGCIWWAREGTLRELHEQQAELDETLRAAAQHNAQLEAADADEPPPDTDGGSSVATIEVAPQSIAGRALAREEARAKARVAAAGTPGGVATKAAPQPVLPPAPTTERPADFRNLAAAAIFMRGRYNRETGGFGFAIPSHFHVLSGHDAHSLDAALGRPNDPHLVGWALHEHVNLADPNAWHIVARWLDDGQLASDAAGMDPSRLLPLAQRGVVHPRLAGSGGDLVGYAIEPALDDGVIAWVEERLPSGAGATVLDCHALRAGPRGVVEFSIVAASAGMQSLCYDSVRLFARRTQFANASSAVAEARRAPYSLSGLVTQTQ